MAGMSLSFRMTWELNTNNINITDTYFLDAWTEVEEPTTTVRHHHQPP